MHNNQKTLAKGMTASAIALCIAGALPLAATAQQAPTGFSLGLVMLGENGIYAGESNTMQLRPLLRYDSDAFTIGLPEGVRITAMEQPQLRLSAVAAPRMSQSEGSDAAELAGLDRPITADVGVLMEYELGEGTDLSLRAVTELTGEHNGSEVTLAVERAFFSVGVPLILTGGFTWQSKELAGYLYGVAPSEVIAGRAAYDPGDALIPFVNATTFLPISQEIAAFANVGARFLPGEVTDSSIIDEDMSISTVLGLSYNF